ncbi:hypothetical protein POM88_051441 [Heracleum sosnowskyi]|uniref:Uncharacterized protein n=1 Tax=Heracleum sosnowskyi TaxID=360622 RepID=A0AAD8M197_9APIA|nr:hypothetical protein POM88_051441 [Heracleum sosnowskyi]
MVDTKLYLCFKATNTKEESVYLIFSAKVSDLTGNAQTSTPHFTFENSITGVSSMGCGLFDSKIVLTGGVSGKENNMEYKYRLVTYDIVTKKMGELSSYFDEGENDKFCLTTFDNVDIHVYVFEIFSHKGVDGGLSLVIFNLKKYKYNYNDFSHEGITSISSISGCFVLPRDDETKRSKESKLHKFFLQGEDLFFAICFVGKICPCVLLHSKSSWE